MNFNPYIIRVSIAFIVMVICMVTFFSSMSYPLEDDPKTSFSNAYRLQEAVPVEVYSYTITRLDRYFEQQGKTISDYSLTIDGVEPTDDGYGFILIGKDADDALPVTLKVENYGNFFSISVSVNGQVQDIS